MPFPYHDRYWTHTAQFLRSHHRADELILAPTEFVDEFPSVHAYAASFRPGLPSYPWVVLHKGLLDDVANSLLTHVNRKYYPVFANEVFVVFSQARKDTAVPRADPHLNAFRTRLATQREKAPSPHAIAESLKPRPNIATLSVEQIREEMNNRYRHSDADEFCGYEHPHLWDKVRYDDIDRMFRNMIGSAAGQSVLEVACGLGRHAALVSDCQSYTGIDLSDVAIERVRAAFVDRPQFRFLRMDCQSLDFPACSFDTVLAIEMIEHVHDAPKVIAEISRVLKPGGRLFINSANRDSLHLRILRKLGLPEFKATIEHIREFSYKELKALLEACGFTIQQSAGSFLLPYYGIPDMDGIVRHLTDDDPEIVEVFRDLGERAGAEYAYEFLIGAVKNGCA